MQKSHLVIAILLVLVVAVGTFIFLGSRVSEHNVTTPAIVTVPDEPSKQPIIRYAVPETPPAQTTSPPATDDPATADQDDDFPLPAALPSVQDSDSSIRQALGYLLGGTSVKDLIIVDSFIQRLVLTIHNLPEKKLPLAHIPLSFPEGRFIISGTEGSLRTNPENFKRYTPYITLLEGLDQNQVIRAYVHFYPLFQTAYQQLGFPNAYFNDRLVEVIEHLLATPNPVDPLALLHPSVLYTYADPALENLSAGQKALLRMGLEQRLKVLSILRNYHFRLTRLSP